MNMSTSECTGVAARCKPRFREDDLHRTETLLPLTAADRIWLVPKGKFHVVIVVSLFGIAISVECMVEAGERIRVIMVRAFDVQRRIIAFPSQALHNGYGSSNEIAFLY
jgi:hypothetical protein